MDLCNIVCEKFCDSQSSITFAVLSFYTHILPLIFLIKILYYSRIPPIFRLLVCGHADWPPLWPLGEAGSDFRLEESLAALDVALTLKRSWSQ